MPSAASLLSMDSELLLPGRWKERGQEEETKKARRGRKEGKKRKRVTKRLIECRILRLTWVPDVEAVHCFCISSKKLDIQVSTARGSDAPLLSLCLWFEAAVIHLHSVWTLPQDMKLFYKVS